MIIFIGGFSCTGKTQLAQKLLKEKQIPYFSVDYIKMGIFRSNPNCGFTPLDSDEHIAGYLWPIIREMAYIYFSKDLKQTLSNIKESLKRERLRMRGLLIYL